MAGNLTQSSRSYGNDPAYNLDISLFAEVRRPRFIYCFLYIEPSHWLIVRLETQSSLALPSSPTNLTYRRVTFD